MFRADHASWPLVLHEFRDGVNAADEDAYFTDLDRLTGQDDLFVLVTALDGHSRFSDEGRRSLSLWFKANRGRIGDVCMGLVRVRPWIDPAEDDDRAFRAAMPCPSVSVRSLDEGLAAARAMLAAKGIS